MAIKGIDVSQWQGDIDFKKVKAAGIEYVIIRAGYGKYIKQKDPYFEQNYKRAKAAGLDVGVYWYSYAASVDDAKLEAKTCLEAIKGKKFEYPIYFDLEEKSQFNKGRAFCDSIVKAFCGEIEKAGYFAGLYCSTYYLSEYVSQSVAARYALWVAQYASKNTYTAAGHGMWQYSSTGKVNGISGNVDCNYCYVDYPTIIKSGGFNGYPKSSDTTKEKPTLDSSGLKRGDKSGGVLAYKYLLKLAGKAGVIAVSVDENGTFGEGTEKATNALLKKWGYKENGVAGSGLMKKIYSAVAAKVK